MITISFCSSSTPPRAGRRSASSGVLAAVGGDRGEVAAGVLGPDVVVEQHDRATSRCRRSGCDRCPTHLVALRRIAQDRRELARLGAERPGGQHRVEVRQPEGARVHVERDVVPRVARGARRARCSGGSPRSRCAGRDARPAAAPLRSRRCGSPRRPRRRRPRRACACASRRRAPSARSARQLVLAAPPAPARTRARSSSPRRRGRATRAAAPASRRARRRRRAGRRGRASPAAAGRSGRG